MIFTLCLGQTSWILEWIMSEVQYNVEKQSWEKLIDDVQIFGNLSLSDLKFQIANFIIFT